MIGQTRPLNVVTQRTATGAWLMNPLSSVPLECFVMELKYFKKGNTEDGYGEPGFCLGNIFSLREENRVIILTEECDGYHKKEMSPEAAVEMFEEAIKIIKHAAP